MPPEPGEAAEINVERHHLGAVLDGQGGEVGIIDVVAGGPQRRQQAVQKAQVARGWLKENRSGLRQPGLENAHRLRQRQGVRKHGTSGRQAKEREQHDPGKADRLRASEGGVEPASGCGMMRRILIDGVDEHVGVDDSHGNRLLASGQLACQLVVFELACQPERLVQGDAGVEPEAKRRSSES